MNNPRQEAAGTWELELEVAGVPSGFLGQQEALLTFVRGAEGPWESVSGPINLTFVAQN